MTTGVPDVRRRDVRLLAGASPVLEEDKGAEYRHAEHNNPSHDEQAADPSVIPGSAPRERDEATDRDARCQGARREKQGDAGEQEVPETMSSGNQSTQPHHVISTTPITFMTPPMMSKDKPGCLQRLVGIGRGGGTTPSGGIGSSVEIPPTSET